MPQGISLIVGLGNPGAEYADTRHNAGFRFLDTLAGHTGCSLRLESRFSGKAGKALIGDREVWLLAPQTFMNRSGEAVAKLAHYYKIPVKSILVAHDELDLPVGAARLKQGGGAGGHNGLSDMIDKLGSTDFLRLRIGIGRPATSEQVLSYVLKKAPSAEQKFIDAAIHEALIHLDEVIRGHLQKAMTSLHAYSKDGYNLPAHGHKKIPKQE
ncbi:MAG TPA: aminoacyl-tRNA hydrolase [Acidiferrobacterales bacterium]|nr:aminoacyl-tRNA hydrolase [Acidiferrobacterales bacterium]